MKKTLFFILFVINFNVFSQTQTIAPIRVYFKKNSLKINHSEREIDSLLILIDSLTLKYQLVKVIPLSLSNEIQKDKYIDFKRAQVAIEFFQKRSKIKRGKFYILYIRNEFINENGKRSHDFEIDNKCWVSFEPLRPISSEK